MTSVEIEMPVLGSLGRSGTSRSKSRSRGESSHHSASSTSQSTASLTSSIASPPSTSNSTHQNESLGGSKGKEKAADPSSLLPPANIHPTSSNPSSSSPSSNNTVSTENTLLASPFNPTSNTSLKKSPSLSRLKNFGRRSSPNLSTSAAVPPVPPLPLPATPSPSSSPDPTTPTAASSPAFASTATPAASTSPVGNQQSPISQSPEEIDNNSNMLLPPQPAFLARRSSSVSGHGGDSGSSSGGYNSRNASTTSFNSSMGAGGSYALGHSEESFVGEKPDRGRLDRGGNVYGNESGSVKPKERSNSHGASGATGIKGFGRRLFSRTTPQSTASRSHSTSSSGTSQSSPPLTPTTPPLPLDALNKRAAASGMMSPLTLDLSEGGLPQLPPLNMNFNTSVFSKPKTGSKDQFTTSSISSSSVQSSSNQFSQSPTSNLTPSSSLSSAGFSSKDTGHSSFMPTLPPTSASPPRRNESLPFVTDRVEHRGLPSPTPTPTKRSPEGGDSAVEDSDFLRAVLSFGDTDADATATDTSYSFSSANGGGYSSFATSNASTSQSFRNPFGSNGWNSPGIPKTMRESEAREWERRERENAVKRIVPKHRQGLFSRRDQDEDSEDDYGAEDEEEDLEEIEPKSEGQLKKNGGLSPSDAITRRGSSPSQWPTAKGVSLTRSPSSTSTADSFHSLIEDSPVPASQIQSQRQQQPQVGLETPGKRSLYTATLLKVHPHLSSCLKVSSGGQEPINVKSNDTEIRFPRSINQAKSLQSHNSNFSFSRSLSVAVARTLLMKRLKRDRLPLAQEVEISWFQTKYGSELISPEEIAAGLASRPIVSPEALAVSPVMGSNTSSSNSSLSRSSSADTLSLATDSEALKKDNNGLTLWAQRPSFMDRCSEFRPDDDFNPGDVVISQLSSNFSKRLSQQGQGRASFVKPAPLSFSARICTLAEIAPPTKPGSDAPPPTKFRKRDAERPAREEVRRVAKAPPPWIASRTGPSPGVKQAMDRSAALAALTGDNGAQQNVSLPSSPSLQQGGLSRSSSMISSVGPTSSTPKRASTRSNALQNRTAASGRDHGTVREEDEDNASAIMAGDGSDGESSEEEEEVPLALLHAHRKERERIAILEAEVQALRAAQQHSQLEKERYEFAERKKREEERLVEYNKKVLAEARARRGKTEHSAILTSNNYGAGDATALSPSASRPDLRRSNSNLKAKIHHSSSMVDLHSTSSNVGLPSAPSIYSNRAAMSRGSSSNLHSPSAIVASPSKSARSPGQQTLSPPSNTLSPPPLASTTVRRRSSFNGKSDGIGPIHSSGPSSPLIGSPPVPTPHRSSTLPHSPSLQVNGYSNALGYGAPHSPSSPTSPTGLPGLSPSASSMRVSSRQPHTSKPLLSSSQSSQFGGLLAQQQAQQQAILEQEQSMRHAQMMAHQAQQMQYQAARHQQHHQSQMMGGGMTNSMSMGQVNPYFHPQPLVNLDPRAIPSSATQRFSGWQ